MSVRPLRFLRSDQKPMYGEGARLSNDRTIIFIHVFADRKWVVDTFNIDPDGPFADAFNQSGIIDARFNRLGDAVAAAEQVCASI